jgi:hypothetical protein
MAVAARSGHARAPRARSDVVTWLRRRLSTWGHRNARVAGARPIVLRRANGVAAFTGWRRASFEWVLANQPLHLTAAGFERAKARARRPRSVADQRAASGRGVVACTRSRR